MHNATEKDYPLVSVIIPTLNQGKYLEQSIESALSQGYPNLEVIVVDNGSTDNTPEILTSFGDKIRCSKEEERGRSAACNKGIEVSRGELIAFLDSDDYYLPGKVSLSVKRLLEDRSVSVVSTDYILVDTENSLLEEVKSPYPSQEEFARRVIVKCCFLSPTVMMRKKCLEKVGRFRTEFLAAQADDLCLRLLKAGYRFGHIPEMLYAYRWHADNICRNKKFVRFYSDKARFEALGNFTTQELFGDLTENNDWKGVRRGYEELAKKLYKRRLLDTAEAALEKAAAIKESYPQLSLSIPILKMKIAFQKHRKRTLLVQNK